jgi:3-dehydroquinate synthase
MTRVTVTVPGHSYEVLIASGLLAEAGSCLREIWPGHRRVFVITVPVVRRKWGKQLLASLKAAGFDPAVLEILEGETQKRLSTVETLAEKLVKLGADRSAGIIAFGGGVIGDIAGFLASIYMRGIDFVQIPTTVVAQVDASIGGKTGVNLRSGKNLIGTFHQPRTVLIDPALLSTLPEREFRSGLYESLKCGVIGNPKLFRRFEENRQQLLKRDPQALERVITESVELKASIVSADEREGGLRRVLNFGHTIGHALEAETGYRRLLHGEAVGWGMIAATNIALSMQKTSSVTAGQIADAVLSLGPLPKVEVSSRKVLSRTQSDKKTRNGRVHFILPREVGKVEVVDNVPEQAVLEAVEEVKRLSRS